MGLPVEVNNLLLGGARAYTIGRSLRFRSSASAYLNRTPASAGNRQIFTISAWVKLGSTVSVDGAICGASTGSTLNFIVSFINNQLYVRNFDTSVYNLNLITTQVFRDPSAWYHVVVAIDTTQTTASNRAKVYINGTQVTSFSTATYPALNYSFDWNKNVSHLISARYSGTTVTEFFDGYLAEFYNIDGQALAPSAFGETDLNGIWQPKKYAGTYGTNGFYLPFSNTTSTTTLVQDSSGNGNNWTPNNISLTAGTTYDSMIDSPTVSASSSNYAVLNPLRTASNATVSNGNLSFADTTNNHNFLSTIGITSGKWYFEFSAAATGFSAAHMGIALATISPDTYIGSDTNGYAYHATTGQVLYNNSALGTYSTWTAGDIISVAYDADGGKLYVAKNNTWQNSGNPAAGTGAVATGIASGTWFFGVGGNPSSTMTANFGAGSGFTYTPPTGFNALNTYNLPAASITNGAQNFAATTYSGDSVDGRSITNGGNNSAGSTFQPDLVWIKDRSSGSFWNVLFDSVRGVGNQLSSNQTDAELASASNVQGKVSAFNSNGFTLAKGSAGTYSGLGSVNYSPDAYIAWQWKGGGTAVTNNSGTITSQVSANASAGFSIVTYTGTGANATVGHGLGVAPSMIIIKKRNNTWNWSVYHSSIGNTAAIFLNLTSASSTAINYWNNTSPTSSVFSVGNDTGVNNSADTYVAYCFAAVRGYSAFGSYSGTGSSDGPFIFTNFRPRWLMVKSSTIAHSWEIYDTSRDPYNVAIAELDANSSAAEYTAKGASLDFLSNGFKVRYGSSGFLNVSGQTYIYAAFAENPFSIARAR